VQLGICPALATGLCGDEIRSDGSNSVSAVVKAEGTKVLGLVTIRGSSPRSERQWYLREPGVSAVKVPLRILERPFQAMDYRLYGLLDTRRSSGRCVAITAV
jgi:hypothetical protein